MTIVVSSRNPEDVESAVAAAKGEQVQWVAPFNMARMAKRRWGPSVTVVPLHTLPADMSAEDWALQSGSTIWPMQPKSRQRRVPAQVKVEESVEEVSAPPSEDE